MVRDFGGIREDRVPGVRCSSCRHARNRGRTTVYCQYFGMPIHKDFRKEECFSPMIVLEEKDVHKTA